MMKALCKKYLAISGLHKESNYIIDSKFKISCLIFLKIRMKTLYVEHGMIGGRSFKNAKNSNLKLLRMNEIESAKEKYQWQIIEGDYLIFIT
jgi:hypothetical protein